MRDRINPRVITFALVVLIVVGYPAYLFLDLALSGGIKNKGDYYEVDLKTISDFEMDQKYATDQSVPAKFRELDGKRVLLDGEIVAGQTSAGAQARFDLVYSIQKCCLSGNPKVQHFIKCNVVPGREEFSQYHPGVVKVLGTLHVKVERDEVTQKVTSVYKLDVESVEPR
jgi:hypothetical protein